MPSALPTTTDLYAMLYGAGVITANPPTGQQASLDYAGALAASIEEFARRTGYNPFLGDTVDQTIYFSPRNIDFPPDEYPHLDFAKSGGPGGILSVTSLRINYTATSGGTLLTQGTDFVLREKNASLKNRPYTYLEFVKAPQFGFYGLVADVDSIQLIGKRGYWSTVPDLAFQGMLAGAAIQLVPRLEILRTSGLVKVKLGLDEFEYNKPLSPLSNYFQAQFKDAIARYKRLSIF